MSPTGQFSASSPTMPKKASPSDVIFANTSSLELPSDARERLASLDQDARRERLNSATTSPSRASSSVAGKRSRSSGGRSNAPGSAASLVASSSSSSTSALSHSSPLARARNDAASSSASSSGSGRNAGAPPRSRVNRGEAGASGSGSAASGGTGTGSASFSASSSSQSGSNLSANGGTGSSKRVSPSSHAGATARAAGSATPDPAQRGEVKVLPAKFEDAEVDDIVVLVADMLSRLITHNDQLPLHPSALTRFHSRATPQISIASYLRRIARYTSLDKACALILLVYIDRVCERMQGFTICGLTVHRFVCASVVCASKALCDAFSTNGHYARVGGISLVELNMLEKEFLGIIDWRLTCSGALLQHYYTSLVRSHPSFELEEEEEDEVQGDGEGEEAQHATEEGEDRMDMDKDGDAGALSGDAKSRASSSTSGASRRKTEKGVADGLLRQGPRRASDVDADAADSAEGADADAEGAQGQGQRQLRGMDVDGAEMEREKQRDGRGLGTGAAGIAVNGRQGGREDGNDEASGSREDGVG